MRSLKVPPRTIRLLIDGINFGASHVFCLSVYLSLVCRFLMLRDGIAVGVEVAAQMFIGGVVIEDVGSERVIRKLVC